MFLSRVLKKTATTALDGWTEGVWTTQVARGSLRFLFENEDEKSVVRSLITDELINPIYTAFRAPDGSIFIILSVEADFSQGGAHGFVYSLHKAQFTADIYTLTTSVAASGAARNKELTLEATVPCDIVTSGPLNSSVFKQSVYTGTVLYFPGGTELNSDQEVQINGAVYELREVYQDNVAVKAVAVKK